MPNTFIHIGLQTFGSRMLLKGSDVKWILLGCIIPDIPWIIQRFLLITSEGVDPYFLRSYVIVQAALFSCVILSGALALFAVESSRVFLLLAANSLLHLVLDAGQIKWANGVHFFAPFSWRLTGFGLAWPEHMLTHVLTGFGAMVLVYYGLREWRKPLLITSDPLKHFAAVLLLAIYLTLPFILIEEPIKADNHYLATLLNRNERTGKEVELDRGRYRSHDRTIRIFSGERLQVAGHRPGQDGVLSARGHFVDTSTIHISAFHVHSGVRDLSSILALVGILLVWFAAWKGSRISFRRKVRQVQE